VDRFYHPSLHGKDLVPGGTCDIHLFHANLLVKCEFGAGIASDGNPNPSEELAGVNPCPLGVGVQVLPWRCTKKLPGEGDILTTDV
jgi:hypothetical protein